MYKGFTLDQIKTILDYNKETGVFKSRVSGKELVGYEVAGEAMPHRTFSYRDIKTKRVHNFQLARVAYMLGSGTYLGEKDRITFNDGDVYNLKYNNLSVVTYQEIYAKKTNYPKNVYLETEHEHIYVGTLNGLFVVRRGPQQAIYRTYNKEEAVAVMNRWLESGKVLHENDDFCPKWYKNLRK